MSYDMFLVIAIKISKTFNLNLEIYIFNSFKFFVLFLN